MTETGTTTTPTATNTPIDSHEKRTPEGRSKFDALPPQLAPVGLRREAAAAYWSVSPSAFDKLVSCGVAPRSIAGLPIGVKLWDRRQLDERFAELSGFHFTLQTEPNDWDGGT